MSYANGTAHFNLPQTVGTDKRDWSDTNEAFAKLDAAVQANTDANTASAENITVLQNEVSQNTKDIANHATEISALQNDMTEAKSGIANNATNIAANTASIGDVRTDTADMITAYNETSAQSKHYYAQGDYFIYNNVLYRATATINVDATIIPNTNCAATNVTTELLNLVGGGSGLEGVRNDLEGMVCFYSEADTTSDHDYAVGDYFIYDDKLYKVNAAIGTGDTIIPNSNCTVTTITSELIGNTSIYAPAVNLQVGEETATITESVFVGIDNKDGRYSRLTFHATGPENQTANVGYSDDILVENHNVTTGGTATSTMTNITSAVLTNNYHNFENIDISASKGHYCYIYMTNSAGGIAAYVNFISLA